MKFFSKNFNFVLLSLFVIILWLIAGLTSGKVLITLVSPKNETVILSHKSKEKPLLNSLVSVLGSKNIKQVSKKNIKIIGLVAGTNNGAILVSIDEGPIRALRFGEISEDGWVFNGISSETVTFLFKDQSIKIPYINNKKNNLLKDEQKKINKLDLTGILI